jgi:hypothetical protein
VKWGSSFYPLHQRVLISFDAFFHHGREFSFRLNHRYSLTLVLDFSVSFFIMKGALPPGRSSTHRYHGPGAALGTVLVFFEADQIMLDLGPM